MHSSFKHYIVESTVGKNNTNNMDLYGCIAHVILLIVDGVFEKHRDVVG